MAQARKFSFDTEFAADGAVLRETPKRLTPEEIEAQCAAAYERGKQDALAQAERDAAAALGALAHAASAVLSHLDAESRAMREEAARLAITAARKIADAALDAFGVERAAAAIEAAMDALRHQPRLVVKLSPAAAETLKPRIDAISEKHAYAGAVLVRAEPGFGEGEVSIDWSDGVITLDPAEAGARINTLLEAALAAEPTQV
jgi:flagellar assembly protein FliH